jgi:hypothetical protein
MVVQSSSSTLSPAKKRGEVLFKCSPNSRHTLLRSALHGFVQKSLFVELEKRGGLPKGQDRVTLQKICDSNIEVFRAKGSSLHKACQDKVYAWKKLSSASYLELLHEYGAFDDTSNANQNKNKDANADDGTFNESNDANDGTFNESNDNTKTNNTKDANDMNSPDNGLANSPANADDNVSNSSRLLPFICFSVPNPEDPIPPLIHVTPTTTMAQTTYRGREVFTLNFYRAELNPKGICPFSNRQFTAGGAVIHRVSMDYDTTDARYYPMTTATLLPNSSGMEIKELMWPKFVHDDCMVSNLHIGNTRDEVIVAEH